MIPIIFAISMVTWLTSVESDVKINETNIGHNKTGILRIEQSQAVNQAEIIRKLERIEDRLADG